MMRKFVFFFILPIAIVACQSNSLDSADVIVPPSVEHNSTINRTPPSSNPDATYYLGLDNCNDDGSGSFGEPFCDMETAVNHLQPGDTLIIQSGEYAGNVHLEYVVGILDAPIIIAGESREDVIFDGGCPHFPCPLAGVHLGNNDDDETGFLNLLGSKHVVLRNFTVQNSIGAGVSVNGGTNIAIQDLTIIGIGNPGLLVQNVDGLLITGNDISYATMGYVDQNGDVQIGAHEALSVLASANFEVAYNTVHDNPKEGIDIKESSMNGTVHHNQIERACAVAVYINEAHHVVVQHNEIHHAGYFLNDGVVTPCNEHPVFGALYGNYYGNGIQLAVGDLGDRSQGALSHITVTHNIVWDVMGNGLEFWDELRESRQGEGEMTDNLVANNVFYNTQLGGIRVQDVANSVIVNNILALNEEDGITGDHQNRNEISHNLFFPKYDWQEATGSHAIMADPLFVDALHGDFNLQSASPAIDQGIDWGVDYLGSAPDIGAFEAVMD